MADPQLAEALTTIARQGVTKYALFHEPHFSAEEKSSALMKISFTVFSIYIVCWIATVLGGFLIVFRRSKYQTAAGQALVEPPG